jgi:hypothetical protein
MTNTARSFEHDLGPGNGVMTIPSRLETISTTAVAFSPALRATEEMVVVGHADGHVELSVVIYEAGRGAVQVCRASLIRWMLRCVQTAAQISGVHR